MFVIKTRIAPTIMVITVAPVFPGTLAMAQFVLVSIPLGGKYGKVLLLEEFLVLIVSSTEQKRATRQRSTNKLQEENRNDREKC